MKQFAYLGFLVWVMAGVSACSDAPTPDAPSSKRAPVTVIPIGSDDDHLVLRNQVGDLGNVRDMGVVVQSGDRIEVRPTFLVREERKPLPPQVTRQDNSVCTQTAEVCLATIPVTQHQCDDHCSVCLKCVFVGCFPWRCCDTVCQDVHVGDRCIATQTQCTQTQNQWKETSTFSGLDQPQMVQDKAPMKSAALMTSGLKLRFSYLDAYGTAQQSDCGLDQFKPSVDEEKITLQLANVDACPAIFTSGAKAPPTLSLVNAMDSPISYSQGSLVKSWDGQVSQKPTEAVYLPSIDFAGTLTVFAVGN